MLMLDRRMLLRSGSAAVATHPSAAPAQTAKPIRVVRPADLGAKIYLDTKQDVEDYVTKLRAELLAAIDSGYRARIQ